MKTVFLMIRHGESEGNAAKIFCGQKNVLLSDLGRQQAARTAEFLADRKVDAVYASDLSRAFDTAAIIADSHHLRVIPEPELREISGGKWEGLTTAQVMERYGEDYRNWKRDLSFGPTGGEGAVQAQTRMGRILRRLAEENPGKTLCIGTHGGILRAFAGGVMRRPSSELRSLAVAPNASVTTVEYEDGVFRLLSYGEAEYLQNERKNVKRSTETQNIF